MKKIFFVIVLGFGVLFVLVFVLFVVSGLIIFGIMFGINDVFCFINNFIVGEQIVLLIWNLLVIGGFFDIMDVLLGNSSSFLIFSGLLFLVGVIFLNNVVQDGLLVLIISFIDFNFGEILIFGVDIDFLFCFDCNGINGDGFINVMVIVFFSNGQVWIGIYIVMIQ